MNVEPTRRRKGELKMAALADQIERFHAACCNAEGHVDPGPTIHLGKLDPIINALDEALVSVRTLDLEVFSASNRNAYEAARTASPQGQVVVALIAPRNNAVHHADVIDPDVARAIGPISNGRVTLFPRWRPRAKLPVALFEYDQGKKKGQLNATRAQAYDTFASGRLVLDTLLDAFAFFHGVDAGLAPHDADGYFGPFPLPSIPGAIGYQRLAPGWPSSEDFAEQRRREIQDQLPAGNERQIIGRVEAEGAIGLCGWTPHARGAWSFVESVEQVEKDVAAGFRYVVPCEGSDVPLVFDGHSLQADGAEFDPTALPDVAAADEPWDDWWSVARENVTYYERQRLQA